MRRTPYFENLTQDAAWPAYGLRMVAKWRGISAVLALTLALGIGVNAAIFSVLNGWLLRPLPVRAPEQIAVVAFQPKETSDSKFSYPDLVDFEKQAGTFSSLFAFAVGGAGLSADGVASEFAYSAVTGNYFSALGVKPLLGRLLLPGEGEKPGEELLVVLGYAFWQKRFGGDAGLVGKRLLVNGQPATVIGVTPREFHGTMFAFDMDGYLSLNALPQIQGSSAFWTDRHDRDLMVLGRLKPDTSIAQAQSSLTVIAQRLAAQYPATNKDATMRVIPERFARPAPFVTNFVPIIASLFLIPPALVRCGLPERGEYPAGAGDGRQRDMAVRAALGAGRGRLIREMLTECLLLALPGGMGGMLLGEWAISASGAMIHSVTSTSSGVAFRMDYTLDWRVFTYTLGIVILSGILLGVSPAWRAGRVDVNTVLREGGRSDSAGVGSHGIRSALLVAQVSGSLMLLIVAGLFVRSLERAEHMDLGFDPGHVLNVMLDVRQIGYDDTRRHLPRTQGSRARLAGRPISQFELQRSPANAQSRQPYSPRGSSPAPRAAAPGGLVQQHSPRLFETMRIPLLEGRTFQDSDNESARQVAIVNQSMAKRFWLNQDPIGKRFSLKSDAGPFLEVVAPGPRRPKLVAFFSRPAALFLSPLRARLHSVSVSASQNHRRS